jgi:type II secretory pathway predicted ATPase ExeA/septal ring-binding cell division protein DamX
MYLSHFGLNEPPFRITPHTEFFFSGANRGATLEALLYAITHDEGIVKVTGEVGSGKTMLCRVLVERLPKSVETIYLANPSLSRDEILHVIAADLQVESRGERVTILLRALQERLIKLYAAGRRVVVLIDEAHAMPIETLEEIRLLSNLESNRHKLLQIVLFGQPELDQHLALPNMRQLKERITHSFKLEPLVRSDVESYVDFRMRAAGYRGPSVFAAPAMKLISQSSQGLTRRINILADKSLLAAFADGTHQVTAKHARAAIRDSEFGSARRGVPNAWWFVGAGLAAGLLVGVGLHLWNQSGAMRGVAAAASQSPVETSLTTAVPAAPPAPPGPAQDHSGTKANPGPEPSPGAVTVSSAAPTASVAPALPSPTAEPAAIAPPPAPPVGALLGARPPASGKLAQERFAATQRWLKTAPSGTWTIQLMTVGDSQAIERFLEEAAQAVQLEDVYLYGVKQNGRQYYGVTYGNYPTLEDTITAMGDLPTSFKSRGPFHRSIGVMRRQNQE